jgi:hypothetical protein
MQHNVIENERGWARSKTYVPDCRSGKAVRWQSRPVVLGSNNRESFEELNRPREYYEFPENID